MLQASRRRSNFSDRSIIKEVANLGYLVFFLNYKKEKCFSELPFFYYGRWVAAQGPRGWGILYGSRGSFRT